MEILAFPCPPAGWEAEEAIAGVAPPSAEDAEMEVEWALLEVDWATMGPEPPTRWEAEMALDRANILLPPLSREAEGAVRAFLNPLGIPPPVVIDFDGTDYPLLQGLLAQQAEKARALRSSSYDDDSMD